MQIYIHRDGLQFGPYSIEQAKGYIASGNLLGTDLAWHEGSADWVPLGQVPGIAPDRARTAEPAWVPPRRDGSSAPAATAPQPHWNVPANNPASASHQTIPAASQVTSRRSPGTTSYTRQQRAAGLRNMAVGGLIFVLGTGVTVVSFAAASSSPGGGHYVLAWGAILFGGYRFLRGMVMYSNA